MTFPPYPRNNEDIRTYPGPAEYMACTIVHNRTVRQLMAFRKLRIALGDMNFRDVLIEALDILAHSDGIENPAAWVFHFVRQEAAE